MAGHNLCVFTPYNGMDPETGNGIYTLQADYNYVFSKEGGAVCRGVGAALLRVCHYPNAAPSRLK